MESNEIREFYDLCRLCVVNEGTTVVDEDSQLQQNVLMCTGVKVSVTDNLPSKICNTCFGIVKTFMDFREAVTKNNLLLNSLYDDNTSCEETVETNVIIMELDSEESADENEENRCVIQENNENQESNDSYTYSCIINLTSTTPLGTLTIRKDLFPSPVQETHKENVDIKKVGIKKPKSEETEVIQYKHEETYEEKKDKQKVPIKKPKYEETEVVQYKCEDCRKTFLTWKKLYHHTRQHQKTKKCPIAKCGKMFSTKSDLDKHVRIHTGEKPYKCDKCDKRFTQNCTLVTHKETVHKEDSSSSDDDSC